MYFGKKQLDCLNPITQKKGNYDESIGNMCLEYSLGT